MKEKNIYVKKKNKQVNGQVETDPEYLINLCEKYFTP